MDKEKRGMLLVEQEEAEHNISRIRKQLATIGAVWKDLSQSIITNPESVIFSDAPEPFGNFPIDLIERPTFIWERIEKKEVIAQLIQDLRKEISRLENIQRELHS